MSMIIFNENSKTWLIQSVEGISFSRSKKISNDLITSHATEYSKICVFSFFELLLKTAKCTNSTLVQGTIETFFIHNTSIGSLIWEKPRVTQKSWSPESIWDGYNACQRSYERKILELPSSWWNSQFPSKQVHQFDSMGKEFLKLCVTCNDRLRTENKAYCLRLRDPGMDPTH